ncbi:Endo-1,4-beta-xylanase A precursor [Enhygromyxa salina]|uniref:Endo-1,4-beta-xylanase A n=1 Tax=Enhygromyxa salina TaxID=215803 RepID=A0A0C1ZR07_9BACT|nr:Endo-1,4-beta-xylanase A precursor [Enhygromyxa salina]
MIIGGSPTLEDGEAEGDTTGDGDGDSGDGDGDPATGDGDGDPGDGDGDAGPFVYSEYDPDGVVMIDALFVLTEAAVDEIAGQGQTPEQFLDWRIDDLNAALARSLVDSSTVRSLGYHVLSEDDYMRTGAWPGPTDFNINAALGWLSTYRAAYGADKILMIASTAESQSPAAWGGGAVSSYWVEFLPINHEFGHCMGGGHCNEGDPDSYNFGFPLAGYDEDGWPYPSGLSGGTMMCGNNVNFFSNPEVTLSLAEIEAYVDEGIMQAQDYAAALGPGGSLQLGHPIYANMAQTWRDNELPAARSVPTAKYPGDPGTYYAKDDCAGFYADEGYTNLVLELCSGETDQDLADQSISSVMLGRDVHVNLYTDTDFGAGSTCGGILERLAFSSPSLSAICEHHGLENIDGGVAAVAVYPPSDRPTHQMFEGQFEFHSSGESPFCSSVDGETLTVLRDGVAWTGTAAIFEQTLALPYSIEFDYLSKHVGDDPPADGISVFFAKDAGAYAGQVPPRETLGFIADGTGYAIELNIWTNQVSLRDGDYITIGQTVNTSTYTDGVWVPVRVDVALDGVTLWFDNQQILAEAVVIDDSHARVGIGAGSGAYTSEFSVRNFALVPG